MNKFQEAENIGRALLESFLKQIGATNWQPTTDKYDPVDYYFEYKGHKVVVEIKCRDIKYKDYSTHMIEDSKLKALLKAKEDNGCDFAYYINFFGEDTVFWYNASNVISKATKSYVHCNRTTAINTGKKDKLTWMIPATVAIVYIMKSRKWSKKMQ